MTHEYVLTSYKRPTYCGVCERLLVGLIKQGLRCARCKSDVHQKCRYKADRYIVCASVVVAGTAGTIGTKVTDAVETGRASPRREDGVVAVATAHQFQVHSFTRPTSCAHCLAFIWGFAKQGVLCQQCNFPCHHHCREEATLLSACVPTQHRCAENRQAGVSFFLLDAMLHLHIMQQLQSRDLVKLSGVCRYLYALTADDTLWPVGGKQELINLRLGWTSFGMKDWKDPLLWQKSGNLRSAHQKLNAMLSSKGDIIWMNFLAAGGGVLGVSTRTGKVETGIRNLEHISRIVTDPYSSSFVALTPHQRDTTISVVTESEPGSWEVLPFDHPWKFPTRYVMGDPPILLSFPIVIFSRTKTILQALDCNHQFQLLWEYFFELSGFTEDDVKGILISEFSGVVCAALTYKKYHQSIKDNFGGTHVHFFRAKDGALLAKQVESSHLSLIRTVASGFLVQSESRVSLFSNRGMRLKTMNGTSRIHWNSPFSNVFTIMDGLSQEQSQKILVFDASTMERMASIDKTRTVVTGRHVVLPELELLVLFQENIRMEYDYGEDEEKRKIGARKTSIEIWSTRTGSRLNKTLLPGHIEVSGDPLFLVSRYSVSFGTGKEAEHDLNSRELNTFCFSSME